MDTKSFAAIVGFLIVVAFIASVIWLHFHRSNVILRRWAGRNDFRIVLSEYRPFFKGPFFWTSSNGQTVYYVTVEDDKGQRRHGWVRCGGWWMGMLSDAAEVRWVEEEPARPSPPPKQDGPPLWDRDLDG